MPHAKTPWNPSRTAIARVKNALPAPNLCPYCSADVAIAHHSEIYGRAYGEWPWAYLCTNDGCKAYVGMHPFTNIPLGTLADAELREARKRAKDPFQALWGRNTKRRSEAYAALAAHLGIPIEECHFGWFDVATCERAGEWALSQLP